MLNQRGSLFLLFVLICSVVYYPFQALAAVDGVATDFLSLKTTDYKVDATINDKNVDITWMRPLAKDGNGVDVPIIGTYKIQYLAETNIDKSKMESDQAYARSICSSNSGWRTARHGDDSSLVEGNDIPGGNLGSSFQGRVNWTIRWAFFGTNGITQPGYFRIVATRIAPDFADEARAASLAMPISLACTTSVIDPPLVAPDGHINIQMTAQDKADGKALAAKVLIDGKKPTELGGSKDTTRLSFITKKESKVGFSAVEADPTKMHTIRFELDGYKPVEQANVSFFASRRMEVALAKTSSAEESTISDTADSARDTGGEENSDESGAYVDCGQYLGFQNPGAIVSNGGKVFAFEPARYIACQLLNTFTQVGIWITKYAATIPF